MTLGEYVAVFAAGGAAGMVNTIVGSGSLVTFPTLLAVGYPPVTANVSNTVGLVFGGISGIVGYRRELAGQRRRVAMFACLHRDRRADRRHPAAHAAEQRLRRGRARADPALVRADGAQGRLTPKEAHRGKGHMVAAAAGVFLTGIYGGYFGAAQGIILLSLLALLPGRPAAAQRAQERAGRGGQRRRGAAVHRGRRTSPGRPRRRSPSARSSARSSARPSGAGCRELWLRRIVVVGGTIVAAILIVT